LPDGTYFSARACSGTWDVTSTAWCPATSVTNLGPFSRRTNSHLRRQSSVYNSVTMQEMLGFETLLKENTYFGNHFACSTHGRSFGSHLEMPPPQYQHFTLSWYPVRNKKLFQNQNLHFFHYSYSVSCTNLTPAHQLQ